MRQMIGLGIHAIAMIGIVWALALAILVIGLPMAAAARGVAGLAQWFTDWVAR